MNTHRWKKGTRVRHISKSEWGVGQLLEDANSIEVRVVFEHWEPVCFRDSYASRLRVVTGDEAHSSVLDNLYLPGPGQSRPMVSIAQAKLRLQEIFPGGLHGDKMKHHEREYKDGLRQMAMEWYSPTALVPLMESGQHADVVESAYRLVKQSSNNFPASFKKMAFSNGLKVHTRPREFAEAFCAWVLPDQPDRTAFESFARELHHLGCAKWPILTAYRFLLHPQSDVLIKPENLQKAASLAWYEINYRPELNWLTYETVMAFYSHVRRQISDLDPRDNIDVQNFIWCIDPAQYPV